MIPHEPPLPGPAVAPARRIAALVAVLDTSRLPHPRPRLAAMTADRAALSRAEGRLPAPVIDIAPGNVRSRAPAARPRGAVRRSGVWRHLPERPA